MSQNDLSTGKSLRCQQMLENAIFRALIFSPCESEADI